MASLSQSAEVRKEASNALSPSAVRGEYLSSPSGGDTGTGDTGIKVDWEKTSLRHLLSSGYKKIADIQNTKFTEAERIVMSKLDDRDRAVVIGMKEPLAAVLAQTLIQQGVSLPRPLLTEIHAEGTAGDGN